MFLTQSGEDEVRMRDRQKVALCLGTLLRAFAPDTPRADRDQGLANLVSTALGVVVGVDEAGEAGFLIWFQYFAAVPHPDYQNDAGGGKNECLSNVDATQKETCNQDRRVGEGGAHIRLEEHQRHGEADQGEGLEDVAPFKLAARKIGEVASH